MNSRSTGIIFLVAVFLGRPTIFSQSSGTWTDKQLKDPAVLAKALQGSTAQKPIVFNVGPVGQIKGAVRIGPTVQKENLDALKRESEKVPKDKEIVIYCGCCPFDRCPNVRPALELLKEMKFKNAKLLNLPANLKQDWINKGYPMESE